MEDYSGRQIGNYQLVRKLEKGGQASVYLGKHRYFERFAALKIMPVSLSEQDAQRFLLETRILVFLEHHRIIRVIDFFVEQGVPILVMDYIEGGSLRHHHPDGTRVPLATVVEYIKQVAEALQYAHNNNIMHRDVKPGNILLGPDKKLILSDFGLALFTPSSEQLNTQDLSGTLQYMAPEQFLGKPRRASDQYALGIIAYEWLCGSRPFQGDNYAIAYQHHSVAPPPLRQWYPDLPLQVEQVILKALAKDPEQRFSSIHAFAQALEGAYEESILDEEQNTAPRLTLGSTHLAQASTRKIFLTASPADAPFTARLQADLKARGILFTNDGFDRAAEVEAIRQASLVLVVITPQIRSSPSVREHLHIASLNQRRIVGVWASGDNMAAMQLEDWFKPISRGVIDALNSRYSVALDEIIECLKEDTDLLLKVPSQELIPDEPRNPYKGLRAFDGSDAADFFGRDALITTLTVKLQQILIAATLFRQLKARILTVTGPSGSGKSSVVKAGLIPRLQKGTLQGIHGSEKWIYLDPITPGNNPTERLAYTLSYHFKSRDIQSIHNDLLHESARGLHLLTAHLAKNSGQRVLLFIDQFEELFTQPIPERARQHFIDLLVNATTESAGSLIVVLTLRADFSDQPMYYQELGQAIEQHRIAVLPMQTHELRDAIEQPARQSDVQLQFEDNLIDDLLIETQGQAGALPLLEFTLDQLFKKRQGHVLTKEAYSEIGGVKGALAKHAEKIYTDLPSDEHRQLARTLFLRLIDPGKRPQDAVRRRASISELLLSDYKQTLIIHSVASVFIAARLIITNEMGDDKTLEVSHEALIREWGRLFTWLHEERGDLVHQQAIHTAANDWIRRGRLPDTGLLYSGTRLDEALAWEKRNTPNQDEAAFLQASLNERNHQEALRQADINYKEGLRRKTVNRLRAFVGVLSLLLVVSIVSSFIINAAYVRINEQNFENEQLLKISRSQALAANANTALAQNRLDQALLLSVKATETYDTFEAQDSLLNALEKNPQLVTMLRDPLVTTPARTLIFGANDQSIISSHDLRLSLSDLKTRKRVLFPLANQKQVGSIAVSPDKLILAVSSNEGVWLLNMQTRSQIAQLDEAIPGLPPELNPYTTLTFNQDGRMLASARCYNYAQEGTDICNEIHITLWDIQSKQVVGSQIISAPINSATFIVSQDMQTFVSTDATHIQRWDIATGQPSSQPIITTSPATCLMFDSDNTTLAFGTQKGSVELWNLLTGLSLNQVFTGNEEAITRIAISLDGTMLAASSLDKMVHVWQRAPGSMPVTLLGDNLPKSSVTFSADSKTLASSSEDGTISLWDISAHSTISRQFAAPNALLSPHFNLDGTQLFVGGTNAQVLVYDVKSGQPLAPFDTKDYPLIQPKTEPDDPNLSAIESLAFNKAGTIMAAGRLDGTIVIWDVQTREVLARLIHPNPLYNLMLSDDGSTLLSSGAEATTLLWDVNKKEKIRSIPLPLPRVGGAHVVPVALSPDGKLVAAGNCSERNTPEGCDPNQVQLWDVATGKPIDQLFSKHTIPLFSITFSPDGKTLASSSPEGIRLWDLANMQPKGGLLSLQANLFNDYYHVMFSQDGTKLVSSTSPGRPFSFVVWNLVQRSGPGALAHPIQEEGSFQGSIAFHPDGQQIASISLNMRAPDKAMLTLWTVDIPTWREHACSIVNRNLDLEEWGQFITYETYSKICRKND